MKFAIIGAGMAGLACAEVLSAQEHDIALFDKGRGAGGRMSTRRMKTPLGDVIIDHGAQYFTARDPAFKSVVDRWQSSGLAERWPAAGADAWIGVPGMNAVVRELSGHHRVTYDYAIRGLVRDGCRWTLIREEPAPEQFDAVIVAVPAEQATSILGLHDLDMVRRALRARSQPCWAAMFAFDAALAAQETVVRDRGIIGWAAKNNAKPGRDGPEAWIVQATAPWSAAILDATGGEVEEALLVALFDALDCEPLLPIGSAAHRWRYALSAGTGDGALWDADQRLGVCGDWLLGPRVECAWQSGTRLGHLIANSLGAAIPASGPLYR